MNNNLKINVSGGHVSLGTVAQGGNVTVTGDTTVSSPAAVLARLSEAIRDAAGGDTARAAAVNEQAGRVADAVATGDTGRLAAALNAIKDHHGWALPAITAVVKTVAPKLLALM